MGHYFLKNRNYWLSKTGWCLRTSFSVALLTFLYMYEDTRRFFSFDYSNLNGLPFACFVAIVVKDSNIGASCINAYATCIGTVISSLLCCLVLVCLEHFNSYNPVSALLFTFILAFCLQYAEFATPLGKKVALSLLAVNLIHSVDKAYDILIIWKFLSNVLVGTACGLLGNIIPWQRTASDELSEVAKFNAVSITSLMEDLINGWGNIRAVSDAEVDGGRMGLNLNSPRSPVLGSTHSQYVKYIRQELLQLLSKNLSDMQVMIVEANFGPMKGRTALFQSFATLNRRLLIALTSMDNRLEAMQSEPMWLALLDAFNSYQGLTPALKDVGKRFAAALCQLSKLLKTQIQNDWYVSSESDPLPPTLIKAMSDLQAAMNAFEVVYLRARHDVYYTALNRQQQPDWHIDLKMTLEMNPFLFLIETACNLVLDFDPRIRSCISPTKSSQSPATNVSISISWYDSSLRIAKHYLGYLWRLRADIFPPQSHLFPCFSCPTPTSAHRFSCFSIDRITPAVGKRLRQSLSISLAMLLAGVYGYYSGHVDPSFAAFTVSYVSGGAVAGASIILSFNRCVGFVMAGAVAVLVLQLVSTWEVDNAKLFIGAVIVLVQIPATYMRPLPKYGYAGLCFGFSVPVLLVTYPDMNPNATIQRVIDTIVAVFIFVPIELFLMKYEFSEDLFLLDTIKIFNGIEAQFSIFIEVFRTSNLSQPEVLQSLSSKIAAIKSPTFHLDIKRQGDLLTFIAIEPTLWRPPRLPDKLLEGLLQYEEQAYHAMKQIGWAVTASHEQALRAGAGRESDREGAEDEESHLRRPDFSFLLGPLEQHVVTTETAVIQATTILREAVQRLRDCRSTSTSGINILCCSKKQGVTPDPPSSPSSLEDNFFDRVIVSSSQDLGKVTSFLSTRETTVNDLFVQYSSIMDSLQPSYREKSTRHLISLSDEEVFAEVEKSLQNLSAKAFQGVEGPHPTSTTTESSEVRLDLIASNAEVKIVNAFLASLRDLLSALSGMATVITRMQAHRAVQTADNKYCAGPSCAQDL